MSDMVSFDFALESRLDGVLHQDGDHTRSVHAHVSGPVFFHAACVSMEVTMKIDGASVHAIPFGERVMAEDTLSAFICDLQVVVNFFEAPTKHWIIQQLPVMVTGNQYLGTVQPVHDFNCF